MKSIKNRSALILLLTAAVILFLPGCSNNNPVIMTASNPLELRFSVETSRAASKAVSAADANEIVYIDLNESEDGTHKLYHTPLTEGENAVTLQKGDSFAVGLTHNPGLEDESGYDYITSVGSFYITDSSLNSLPLSGEAQDTLSLGSMKYSDSSFASSADTDSLQTATGYSSTALDSFGAADTIFRNIVNPDIDRNGKYDSDEDSFWRFCTLVDIDMTDIVIDIDNPSGSASTSIARFNSAYLRYCLMLKNFNIGINKYTNWNDICIELKNYSESGSLTANYQFDYAPEEGDWRQIYFPIDSHKFTPGNFTLTINEKEPVLYFDHIKFITPENNYEGFIFPVVECTADAGGNWQTLKWRWVQIRNGEYSPVLDSDTVKLMIKDMFFYFWENGTSEAYSPEHFGDTYHYYENGSIDISSYNFTMGPAEDVNYGLIRTDYWDIGENDYSFGYTIID